jgi:hypothetical protein
MDARGRRANFWRYWHRAWTVSIARKLQLDVPRHPKRQFMQHLQGGGWLEAATLLSTIVRLEHAQ